MNEYKFLNENIYYEDELNEGIASTAIKGVGKGIGYAGKKLIWPATKKVTTSRGARNLVRAGAEHPGRAAAAVGIPSAFAYDAYDNKRVEQQKKQYAATHNGEQMPSSEIKNLPGAGLASAIVEPIKATTSILGNSAKLSDRFLNWANNRGIIDNTKNAIVNTANAGADTLGNVWDSAENTGRAVGNYIKDKYNQTTPIQKIGGAGIVAAAAVVAGTIIADALKKKNWQNTKCENIEDSDEKLECKRYVTQKSINELKSKLNQCKYSNNYLKCKEDITEEINKMENELNNLG